MSDDDAVDVCLREQLVDPLGEFQPIVVIHVFAGNLKHLLAFDVGDFLQFRNSLDQSLDAYGGGLIAHGRRGRCAGAGDRATGRQDHHIG